MKNLICIVGLSCLLTIQPALADPQNGSAGAAAGAAIIVCTKVAPCRNAAIKTAKKAWRTILPASSTQERSTDEDTNAPVSASRKEAKTKVHKCLGLPKSTIPYKQGRISGDGQSQWEYWLYRHEHKVFMIIDHSTGHEKGDVSPHLHGKIKKNGGTDDPADKSNWKNGGKVCHFRYNK
jgi:hypothetical protein